jgi:hypothetical protein
VLEPLDVFVATHKHATLRESIKIADMIRPPISTTDYTDVDHDSTPLGEFCFKGKTRRAEPGRLKAT